MAALHDGADALGQAVLRDGVDITAEESSVVSASLAGQRLDTSSGGQRGAGLVERDMPVRADSQDLEIDTAGVGYGLLVRLTCTDQVRGQSVRSEDMRRIDIDLVDELTSDDVPIALRMTCW